MVTPAVLDEIRSRLYKTECDIPFFALSAQGLNPFKAAGPGSVVIFAAGDDLFDFSLFSQRSAEMPPIRGAHMIPL